MATILFHHNDIAAICRIALRAAGIDPELYDNEIYRFAESWGVRSTWQDLEDHIVHLVRNIVMCHHAAASIDCMTGMTG